MAPDTDEVGVVDGALSPVLCAEVRPGVRVTTVAPDTHRLYIHYHHCKHTKNCYRRWSLAHSS